MPERSKPPFRADHVGSLIRPQALIDARGRAEKRELADAELKRIQHAAIREVVRIQEDLGLKLVTDGEFNRSSWHRDFMLKFTNVRMIPSKLSVRFHSAEGDRLHSPPTMQVTGSWRGRRAAAYSSTISSSWSRSRARRRRSPSRRPP